jgi:hypothetical protein
MKQCLLLALLLAVIATVPVYGQQEIPPRLRERGQPIAEPGVQNAQNTRSELQNLLWQLPPNVRGVLQNDPSLIERPDYLAPYPELAEFLMQHPEVARNPTFFFGRPEDFNRGTDPLDLFAGILAGTALFLSFLTLLFIVGSVARQVVDYRRWVRHTRIQTEVHTKILDRMQTNEDLLAYVQTPAGRNFLEFAPLAAARTDSGLVSAPLGRILWSVQAGVVLAALGIGLRYAQGTVPEEITPAFTVLGIIVMSLGIGAVISAIVAYVLSARLGLLPNRRQETNA